MGNCISSVFSLWMWKRSEACLMAGCVTTWRTTVRWCLRPPRLTMEAGFWWDPYCPQFSLDYPRHEQNWTCIQNIYLCPFLFCHGERRSALYRFHQIKPFFFAVCLDCLCQTIHNYCCADIQIFKAVSFSSGQKCTIIYWVSIKAYSGIIMEIILVPIAIILCATMFPLHRWSESGNRPTPVPIQTGQ